MADYKKGPSVSPTPPQRRDAPIPSGPHSEAAKWQERGNAPAPMDHEGSVPRPMHRTGNPSGGNHSY